jgi:hypothetical protein
MRAALNDPALLGDALPGESWSAWRILLIAAMGEPLSADERVVFTRLTGRESEPGVVVETLLTVAGRRSGKSRAMAAFAVFLSCVCDWRQMLSLGERGLVLFLAPSERQATNVFRYAAALIDHAPLLGELVASRTDGTLSLSNGIDLEVQAASWRRSRGGTAVAIVLDECAYFHSADDSSNSDAELVVALRPSLATTGGPMLLTSSPSTMEGVVYRLHKRHYGPAGDPQIVVVQSDSRGLNPMLSARVVERAYEDDATAAESEYGGAFRQFTTAYLERALIEKAVVVGSVPVPVPLPGISYVAFVDVSGGAGADSYAIAIGHNQRHESREVAVLDALFEARPPFDPEVVTAKAADLLKLWGLNHVVGDAYGGQWPATAFSRHGISYQNAQLTKSEIYLHVLPLFTSARVALLDGQPRLIDRLAALKRRVGQGGREAIDHPRGGHDDSANSVCGMLWRLSPVRRPAPPTVMPFAPTKEGWGYDRHHVGLIT